jgi:hypothetical protein
MNLTAPALTVVTLMGLRGIVPVSEDNFSRIPGA